MIAIVLQQKKGRRKETEVLFSSVRTQLLPSIRQRYRLLDRRREEGKKRKVFFLLLEPVTPFHLPAVQAS
jgi:hypothetical protein